MRRWVLAVGLCCLLVLAGCGGTSIGPGETVSPTGEATPTGDGDDTGSTATPEPFAYPNGTNASSVTDRTALYATHAETLGTVSFASNLTQVVVAGENRSEATSLVRSDPAAERAVSSFTVTEPTGVTSADTFRNGTDRYRRRTVDDRTSYRVRNATGPFEDFHAQQTGLLRSADRLFQLARFAGNGTVERDGRRLARYDLTGINESTVGENTTITSTDGVLLVDERGVVHRAAVEVRGERDGQRQRLRIEYRTTATGDVTVDRPEWLSTAEEESGS